MALRAVGINCCEALPVLALAVPPNSEKTLVGTYTDRLMRNFAVSRDYRRDLAAATSRSPSSAGADEELMFADKYTEAVRGAAVAVDVKLIEGVNHMGIVTRPRRFPSSPTTSPPRHGGELTKQGHDMIDSQQAAEALAEIDEIGRRVRQSRIYELASLMLIMWGGWCSPAISARSAAALCRLYLDRGQVVGHRRIVRDQRRSIYRRPAFAPSTGGC